MNSASRALAAVAATLLLGASAAAEVAVPPLKARVTDQTGTLSASQRDALEAKLAAFEARKGSQIAVLIVPSTQPEAIEQYSIRVVDQWKLGRKGVDDGVLLLVANGDRRLRVEVGRGLEGVIPDAIAKRIVAEYIAPRFKTGDFYGGIDAGVDRLIAVIQGEPLPAPQETWHGGGAAQHDWSNIIFFAIVAVIVLQGVLRAIFGRFGGAAIIGGIAGLLFWLVAGAIVFAVLGAIVAFVVALVSGGATGRRWTSGGWGGLGGGGWSSGGGGGFGGGGGGFSGGGASGSW